MIAPRWRKVWRDLWLNRTRSLLVILSIAVGVFAVGVIASTRSVLSTQLNAAYMAINPASAIILTFKPFNDDVVTAISKMPEVAAVEARRQISVRVKVGENDWQLLQLNAIRDFDDIQVDKIWRGEGQWPPGERELLIERSALPLVKANIGDTIIIKDPSGKERPMKLVGSAHDVYAQFYTMGGMAYGYINFDTVVWLGESRDYTELRFTVAKNTLDRNYIKLVAQKVQDKIEHGGSNVWYTLIPIPGQHLLNFIIQPLLALLGILSILALVLSVFLVINMISALLTQQQKQIGIMKAIGGSTLQIMELYYGSTLIFGLFSLAIAVPLGMVGANVLASGLAAMLNFEITRFTVPNEVILLQIGLAVLVPLIAATYPILVGTRVSAHEAMMGYGLGKGRFGTHFFDRMLLKLHTGFLSRPTIISIRNTFRRKMRLGLTLVTLIMAGAIFITVFSVRDSLDKTLSALLEYFQYDVAVQFTRPYRSEKALAVIEQVEGIKTAEGWAFTNVRRVRPDGTESDNIVTMGPPALTKLVKPTLVEGRWLRPDDHNKVVVNTMFFNDEPDVKLGDFITIKLRDRDYQWQIVGVVLGGGVTSSMFVNYEDFVITIREVGKVEWVFTQTSQKTPEFRKDVLSRLEKRLADLGYRVGIGITVDQDMQNIQTMFAVIVALMSVMAILLAIVGALGLTGTMSINVLERTREVGVMRAVGASNRAIMQIVTIEGVFIGILSWGVAVIIAMPVSKLISNAVGQLLLGAPLSYSFSFGGALGWLGLVVILAAVASFLPAWHATRLTVREVLAYEG